MENERMRVTSPIAWRVPEVSVVVPFFNEEENLPELYTRLCRALESIGRDFEMVFVNDGSRDATAELLEELHQKDSRVMVISLSRNFGHQAAVSAGIEHARGKAVILMDGDLQDPPEELSRFIEAWDNGGEVVYAIRTQRKEGLAKRICYAVFYRLLHAVSDLDIPLDSGDFCLMDRKVVDALRELPERNRFVRGLRTFVGFKQVGVAYERASRHAGKPKYTFRALVRLALDGLIGFSKAPLTLISYAGSLCLCLAIFGVVAAIGLTACDVAVSGWQLVIVALVGCTGMQLLGMGVLAEYVHRIFLETKGRPTYVIGAIKEPSQDIPWQESLSHKKAT